MGSKLTYGFLTMKESITYEVSINYCYPHFTERETEVQGGQ